MMEHKGITIVSLYDGSLQQSVLYIEHKGITIVSLYDGTYVWSKYLNYWNKHLHDLWDAR